MSFGTIQLDSTERDCMALLATGTLNPSRYEAIRHKALLRTAGLSANNTRQAMDEIFQKMATIWPQGDTVKIHRELEKIKKEAISGKLSPYQIVGQVKDMLKAQGMPSKRYRSQLMTQHWTQLSMTLALQPTPKAILPESFDLDVELANQVVVPKAEELMASLEKSAGGKYYESRPYLKTSAADKPNWPEILGNLPKGPRHAALALLKGSKEKPRFAEAGQALAWPEIEGPAEAENQRLNSLLQNLPAGPTGRKTLAMKLAATMKAPPQSVELPRTEMSWRHRSKEKDILRKMDEAKNRGELSRVFAEAAKKPFMFHPDSHARILAHAKARSEILPKEKGIIYAETIEDLEYALNPHSTALPKTQARSDDEMRNLGELKRIAKKLAERHLDTFGSDDTSYLSNELAKVLRQPLPPAAREVIASLAEMPAAAYWLEKKMARLPSMTSSGKDAESVARKVEVEVEKTPPPVGIPPVTEPPAHPLDAVKSDDSDGWDILQDVKPLNNGLTEAAEGSVPSDPTKTGSFADVIIAATEGEPIALDKTYSKNRYTLLHVACRFRSAGVVEETFLAAKEKKLPLFPVDRKGQNPAFECKDREKARLAVQHHAPIHIPNLKGNTAFDENPWIRGAHEQRQKELAAAKKIKETGVLEL